MSTKLPEAPPTPTRPPWGTVQFGVIETITLVPGPKSPSLRFEVRLDSGSMLATYAGVPGDFSEMGQNRAKSLATILVAAGMNTEGKGYAAPFFTGTGDAYPPEEILQTMVAHTQGRRLALVQREITVKDPSKTTDEGKTFIQTDFYTAAKGESLPPPTPPDPEPKTPRVYPPQHTAVEVAARLREEIKRWCTLIESEKERRKRRSQINEEKLEAARTSEDKERIRTTWAYENQQDGQEIACHEARLGEHRRLLQWLTGELWS